MPSPSSSVKRPLHTDAQLPGSSSAPHTPLPDSTPTTATTLAGQAAQEAAHQAQQAAYIATLVGPVNELYDEPEEDRARVSRRNARNSQPVQPAVVNQPPAGQDSVHPNDDVPQTEPILQSTPSSKSDSSTNVDVGETTPSTLWGILQNTSQAEVSVASSFLFHYSSRLRSW